MEILRVSISKTAVLFLIIISFGNIKLANAGLIEYDFYDNDDPMVINITNGYGEVSKYGLITWETDYNELGIAIDLHNNNAQYISFSSRRNLMIHNSNKYRYTPESAFLSFFVTFDDGKTVYSHLDYENKEGGYDVFENNTDNGTVVAEFTSSYGAIATMTIENIKNIKPVDVPEPPAIALFTTMAFFLFRKNSTKKRN